MSAGQERGSRPGRIARFLPILDWASHYNRAWLRPDLIAGLTVAALVVPKALGYAGIANVPIENGLYAAAAGTILYAVFGTSRQISTGPSGALAAVAGSAVILSGVADGQDTAMLVAAIALAAGLMFLVMSVFKMGWISQFISRAVIVGFLFGAAIDVAVGELAKLTGTEASGDNAWQEFWSWVTGLNDLNRTTLLVGTLSLVFLFGLRVVAPKVPGTLVVVAGGLLVSAVFDLGAHGVALVGEVPRGLPSPIIPDLGLVVDNLAIVAAAALGIVMIGFSQSAGDARHFATKNGYRIDIDQESLAQGVANVGAGLFQGIPVSTSLSASSLNDNSGAKSPLASLTTGGVIILTMIVLAPLFSVLPKAVLGAVIIDAVIMGMIDLPAMRRMYRVRRSDFWIALAAIIGVVLTGVLGGIVIGVVLSLGWLVRVVTSPAMPVLGRAPGRHVFRELALHPDDERFPGLLVLRLDGALFFVTADALGDHLRELVLVADPPVTAVVLDCKAVNFIDSQGSEKIGELVDMSRKNKITFRLARVKPGVLEVLARDGVLDRLGADNIHEDVNEAVEAQLASGRLPTGQ